MFQLSDRAGIILVNILSNSFADNNRTVQRSSAVYKRLRISAQSCASSLHKHISFERSETNRTCGCMTDISVSLPLLRKIRAFFQDQQNSRSFANAHKLTHHRRSGEIVASRRMSHTAPKNSDDSSSAAGGAAAGLARALARTVAFAGRGSVAGTFAGMVEETASYPLDLIKTRMQVHRGQTTAWIEFKHALKHEGFLGLFRGLGPPLLASAGMNAVMFGSYTEVKSFLGSGWISSPLLCSFLGGCSGGLAQAFIVGPVDRVKCIMQVHEHGHGAGAAAPGMIATARDVIRSGGARSMFVGMGATLLRDVPGYGMYFLAYDGIKGLLAAQMPKKETADAEEGEHSGGPLPVILAGGTAGTLYSVSMHPIDVIKSHLQTQKPGTKTYAGTLDCARKIIAEHGVGALFRGIGPVAVRAFPANAIGFVVYEWILKHLPA